MKTLIAWIDRLFINPLFEDMPYFWLLDDL
jgi:hypothetical protein